MRDTRCTCKNIYPEHVHFKDCPSLRKGVTKEEILERISSKAWGTGIFGLPEPSTVVDPEKLAELLAEIINKPETYTYTEPESGMSITMEEFKSNK